jgi:hypothetical protein
MKLPVIDIDLFEPQGAKSLEATKIMTLRNQVGNQGRLEIGFDLLSFQDLANSLPDFLLGRKLPPYWLALFHSFP